jgi:hypothetical protein
LTGACGQRYAWTQHSEIEIENLVTLHGVPNEAGFASLGWERRQEPNATLLALNTYCRPFLIPESRLGIWCPEPGYLRLLCFDPDQLAPFPMRDVAGWFKRSQERIYSASAPLAEFEISARLAAGKHAVDVPTEFRDIDELLLVGSYPAASKDDAACAILELHPRAGEVTVLPQTWFTAGKYDLGYQWITRVTRDAPTGRIIGGGIRIGNFELTEDGTGLEKWLE